MTHTCSKQHTPEGCHLTWDRKNNVKDIVLCPMHAAAPELLEALRQIADLWDQGNLGYGDRLLKAVGIADAAIQKATEE